MLEKLEDANNFFVDLFIDQELGPEYLKSFVKSIDSVEYKSLSFENIILSAILIYF